MAMMTSTVASACQVMPFCVGLDYAYPEASKIGGFVSAATQTAKRALFCWSANQKQQSEDGLAQVCIWMGL